jgi:N-acetylmuramoyl-L-alanine amidase
MRDIRRIIIHCSATPEGREVSVDTIRDWHMKKGWSDIGYHFVISLDGCVEVGRPIDRAGAHVRGHNKDSIGICYIGGVAKEKNEKGQWVAKDTLTEQQDYALRELIYALRMVSENDLTIHGHNEFSKKACPSFKVSEKFKDIL